MATAYPAGDAQERSLATVTSGHPCGGQRRVPQEASRLWLKKLVKKKDEGQKIRIGTWNIGTMTERGRELADALGRRVDAACVQETRLKGGASRNLGNGYKLI